MKEKIKALCKDKGISISDLEAQANLANKSIYRWGLNPGEVIPSVDKVFRVAKILGTTVEALMEE